MAEDIRVGDRIVAPFGLREVEGVVLRVSSPGLRPMVTVSLEMPDIDEPYVTSFPREDLRLAA
ncbi:hypothetical protein UO65_5044 [Actinokineospora spheciospongiae]|uniref:Uncharacterized protein n=1 Tax=Actinokineospora spheciospongiae TaxID=909613 RepID=W7ISI9_9PSEU|nr:hypothetical protein [Actinokineospora spheciospongiae]EWC59677.1 hypothetical protein UO65_5044 [Actinokineospora spheciospongiae]PWW65772.1 hypothetical protein DFQ13_102527 [Actinokineospora spheciospongiae]